MNRRFHGFHFNPKSMAKGSHRISNGNAMDTDSLFSESKRVFSVEHIAHFLCQA